MKSFLRNYSGKQVAGQQITNAQLSLGAAEPSGFSPTENPPQQLTYLSRPHAPVPVNAAYFLSFFNPNSLQNTQRHDKRQKLLTIFLPVFSETLTRVTRGRSVTSPLVGVILKQPRFLFLHFSGQGSKSMSVYVKSRCDYIIDAENFHRYCTKKNILNTLCHSIWVYCHNTSNSLQGFTNNRIVKHKTTNIR